MAEPASNLELFDAAVVMPTLLRPSLDRAVRSVFAQDLAGRIQLLIGIDKSDGERDMLQSLVASAPSHVTVTVFDPGYSTSQAHGGLHRSHEGGALRTILSYMAHAPRIAYLDDNNWWAPDHLSSLASALKGAGWSWSLRHFVRADTQEALAVDRWESVGPDAGFFRETHGGFVDPNCLMFDAVRCEPVLRQWSVPATGNPQSPGADRNVFHVLNRSYSGQGSNLATCYCVMKPADSAHQRRLSWITAHRIGSFAGYRLFGEGRYSEALAAFEDLYRIAPPGILGCFWLCVVRCWLGEHEAARGALHLALEEHDGVAAKLTGTADVLLGHIAPQDVLMDLKGNREQEAGASLAFFSAQAAIWQGDHRTAMDLLDFAQAGSAGPEANTAAAQRILLDADQAATPDSTFS
ncbi:MAG: hypothetical protein ACKVH7_07375 [Alphaproteobacteria bacterium]|jgi:hypothetical protein